MIDIPDTRIEQTIRTGTPIEIYRGSYGEDHRPIIIKVLSAGARGTSIERRFRIGLGIHTNLHHSGIVDQLASGEVDGCPYSIEPFLSGGDLLSRLESGISLQAGLKYLKDIARALAYMHAEGYVHGDIKPENLMFASNTQIYIVDFSVTRRQADQPSELGRGSAILATPEYLAPEALTGPDTRSDIYSLGIVFYRILTGKLPFTGDTAQVVIAKHAQEPIPRLPEYLVNLQPIVDKALAKRSDQRYQSALEFVRNVDEIGMSIDLPEVNMKTRAIATQEIRALFNGNVLATVRDAGRQARIQAKSQRRRRVRNVAAFMTLCGALGYGAYFAVENGYILTDRLLAELGVVADPKLVIAWNEAQSLRQDPNQGLATIVAAYRRVLSITVDHSGATQELENLAVDWKLSIAEALEANNLQFSETRLSEANAVFPNDVDWANLNSDLLNRRSAERIYENSVTLLSSQGFSDLPSATAAIQSFHEVLRLAPGHPDAIMKLTELAVHYANLSNTAIAEGRLNDGISLLERATAADRSIPQLDDVRKLISQATTARAAIDDLLREARRLRSEQQLMSPAGENAAELYHRVLATDPENAIAAQGLNEITAQVAQVAEALLSEGELERVDELVTEAQAAALPTEGVAEIRRRLQLERARQKTITDNIASARSLMAAGFLTQPIGNNAVDKLREVQQVDPRNEVALTMLQRCADRLAAVAMEAHEFGLSEDAEQYLDLAITIQPDATEWTTLRDSWESAKTQ